METFCLSRDRGDFLMRRPIKGIHPQNFGGFLAELRDNGDGDILAGLHRERRSHFQTATACANAFKPYGLVILGHEPENLEKALASARAARCDHLVKPEIRIWEDNPTEWTGERDVIEMDVETLEATTGKSISRVVLRGKSRWMTVGDKPERGVLGRRPGKENRLNGLRGSP